MTTEKTQEKSMTLEDLHWKKRYDQLSLWPVDEVLWPVINKNKPLSERKVKARIAELLPLAKNELLGKDKADLSTMHWSNPYLANAQNVDKYLSWCRIDFIARKTHWYGVKEPNWFSLGYVWTGIIEDRAGVYDIYDLRDMKEYELQNKKIPADVSALAYYLFRLGGFYLAFVKLYNSSAKDYLSAFFEMFEVDYPDYLEDEIPELEATNFVELFRETFQSGIQKEFDSYKEIYDNNIAALYK